MDKTISKDTILITASFLFNPMLLFILFFLFNLLLLFKSVFSPMMCPQTTWPAGVFTHCFDVVPAGHLVCRVTSVLIITLFYAFTVQQ
jgi:polyferredoxin